MFGSLQNGKTILNDNLWIANVDFEDLGRILNSTQLILKTYVGV